MNFQVHNRQSKNEKMTLGWKPEKGGLERKQENFRRLMGRANKRMKGQQPGSIQSLFEILNHFWNQKIWTYYSRLYSESWHLIKSSYSGTRKMNLLRCLIFKEFFFLERDLENLTPLSQPNCGNKSFWARSFDLKLTSHSEIPNSDHKFLGEP